jgi:hypothetical protein
MVTELPPLPLSARAVTPAPTAAPISAATIATPAQERRLLGFAAPAADTGTSAVEGGGGGGGTGGGL